MKRGKAFTFRPKASRFKNHSDRIPPIPQETWDHIFCKLNKREIFQARLVCPFWRNIIDNNYMFSITIKERGFVEIPVPFKVITCSIYQLRKNALKIFKYPGCVQNLKLRDTVNPSTLQNLFEETDCLKDLDFAHFHDVEETPVCMPEEPVHLHTLLKLKVFHNNGNYYFSNGNPSITNIQRIFSYEMPVLQRLDLRIIEWWDTIDNILPSFFKFLAKHSKTIKQLRASFIPDLVFGDEGALLPPLGDNIFNLMQPPDIMEQLHDQKFQVTTLVLALTTRYFRLWERIMNNQNNIITLYAECVRDKLVDRFYLVPFASIRPTLARNARSLVNLHLVHLTLQRNPNRNIRNADPRAFLPIDGLVFQHFNKLRRLILKRSKANSLDHEMMQPDETTFVNLSSIPSELLEILEIGWLVCETSELERLVENAPRLKIVIFHYTGDWNNKGVTTNIIDKLAEKSDIQIIDVIPLNLPQNNILARRKLAQLKIQYPGAIRIHHGQNTHFYFNVDKFRKGLVQNTHYMRYQHPVYFE